MNISTAYNAVGEMVIPFLSDMYMYMYKAWPEYFLTVVIPWLIEELNVGTLMFSDRWVCYAP